MQARLTTARRAFSLVELMGVMSAGLILMTASVRLWTGLANNATLTPPQAAKTLAKSLDEAAQASRRLGVPVAVAIAENPGAVAGETQVLTLRAQETRDPEVAVGWPLRLGAPALWRQEGEVRRLPGIRVETDADLTADTFHRPGPDSAQDLSWRLLGIATPDGGWSLAPRAIGQWAALYEDRELAVLPARSKSALQQANVILRPAISRATVEQPD
jgi:hypothetical protein